MIENPTSRQQKVFIPNGAQVTYPPTSHWRSIVNLIAARKTRRARKTHRELNEPHFCFIFPAFFENAKSENLCAAKSGLQTNRIELKFSMRLDTNLISKISRAHLKRLSGKKVMTEKPTSNH